MRVRFGILISLVVLFVFSCKQEYKAAVYNPVGFKSLIEEQADLQLIDVRTPEEVATGYIANAININYRDNNFRQSMEELDKNKPIAVYCAVGQRSQAVYDMLIEMKFHEVYHLSGGTRAWQSEGYSLVKP